MAIRKVLVTPINPKRVTIIPRIHGKITRDGKMSEPDIYWILEKWLEWHPEVKRREKGIQIVRGTWTLPAVIKTDVISVSIVAGKDIDGYDPTKDGDLYAYTTLRKKEMTCS